MAKQNELISIIALFSIVIMAVYTWAYGLVHLFTVSSYIWMVVAFVMPPLGFLIGLYNMIF